MKNGVISFTKMHGTGNDFVILDTRRKKVRMTHALASALCDRHYGVGADQVLVIEKSPKAHARMRIYNADGSEVEMCGNGIRCVAHFLHRGNAKMPLPVNYVIDTPAGLIRPKLFRSGQVRVDMGKPVFKGKQIPVRKKGKVLNMNIRVPGQTFRISCVSMGNPHCVIRVKDVSKVPLEKWGPLLEHHRFFPQRTNVEFVEVRGSEEILVRVWERGAGATLACGTGACAAQVISHVQGWTNEEVKVRMPGGDLKVSWKLDQNVFLTGPASFVYDGIWLS